MKRIAIEEHCFTSGYLDYMRKRKEYPKLEMLKDEQGRDMEFAAASPTRIGLRPRNKMYYLRDFEDMRLAEMDKAGIDMQVLSLAFPGVEYFDLPDAAAVARDFNDELASIIAKYPKRYAGFAVVARNNPEEAAAELERAVTKLGFKGVCVNSHFRGEYLDLKKYDVFLATAERLGVPIYIHPSDPSPNLMKAMSDYPGLIRALWGFGVEAGLHAMRLISGAVFDRHPDLKIIIGHMGEALPFWMWRMDNVWGKDNLTATAHEPGYYLKKNIFMTISGMLSVPALLCAYLNVGADRILFAVDYPFESNRESVEFMDNAPICDIDREKIYHLNAEKIMPF